jgi:hypothetical protein
MNKDIPVIGDQLAMSMPLHSLRIPVKDEVSVGSGDSRETQRMVGLA